MGLGSYGRTWAKVWDIVVEVGMEPVGVGLGFPPSFEYRWAENKNVTPITCSGPQYVDYVLSWVERETANVQNFPTSAGNIFSYSLHLM